MNLTAEDRDKLKGYGNYTLRRVLSTELEKIKTDLLVYKRENKDYDLVLKGKGVFIKELLDLLGD
jgi:hypothetical protein